MNAAAFLLVFVLNSQLPSEDSSRLSIVDLPGYLEALQVELKPSPADRVIPQVSFADLWGQPDRYRDQTVRVAGRATRRFRQPAVGEFPALVELWLIDQARNPLCVVYPEPSGGDSLEAGDTVTFSGRFLRLLSYPGGDAERLAPLIVGPRSPVLFEPSANGRPSLFASSRMAEWLLAVVLALGVALALATKHMRRPPPTREQMRHALDPEPIFSDQPEAKETVGP